jgi:hypothetical protein
LQGGIVVAGVLAAVALLVAAVRDPAAPAKLEAGPARPLPFVTVAALSAYEMLDAMGTNSGLGYQLGGRHPWDLPNRDGEKEVIGALRYLGLHHIRNQGLDDDPKENAATAFPRAPSDLESLLRIKTAIPALKLDFLINAGAAGAWRDALQLRLTRLALLDLLSFVEAPNEPNNQTTYSPKGDLYPRDETAYERIWREWGVALRSLKKSPVFADVGLLPPTSAVHGVNGSDGVELGYAKAGLSDHRDLYDLMNIHSYGSAVLGDPRGDVESGSPRNWGAYQVAIPNWGRYAMPGRPVVVTESGVNSAELSEVAQGVQIVGNFFWAKRYGATRLYQYALVDDSTDLADRKAERWGLYRGDWSPKPAAQYVHNFTSVLADAKPSDPKTIPPFAVEGPRKESWGAVMAFSKSDGSYVIACNNVLPWWDAERRVDLTPQPEQWTIRLAQPSRYVVTDVKTGAATAPKTGETILVAVRGYPMLVQVWP